MSLIVNGVSFKMIETSEIYYSEDPIVEPTEEVLCPVCKALIWTAIHTFYLDGVVDYLNRSKFSIKISDDVYELFCHRDSCKEVRETCPL